MARGPQRPWKAMKGPLLDSHIAASINGGRQPDGHYAELTEDELHPGQPATAEHAAEIRRALYRAARRAQVSLVTAYVERKADGSYQVRFRVGDKAVARAYVIAKYGPDRSKWPYNPRRMGGTPSE